MAASIDWRPAGLWLLKVGGLLRGIIADNFRTGHHGCLAPWTTMPAVLGIATEKSARGVNGYDRARVSRAGSLGADNGVAALIVTPATQPGAAPGGMA
jgi:hypothetical protein